MFLNLNKVNQISRKEINCIKTANSPLHPDRVTILIQALSLLPWIIGHNSSLSSLPGAEEQVFNLKFELFSIQGLSLSLPIFPGLLAHHTLAFHSSLVSLIEASRTE